MDRVLSTRLACVRLALLVVAVCNGCASENPQHNGALPSEHNLAAPVLAPVTVVATLQPTFQWTRPKELGVFTYELEIWLGVHQRDGAWGQGKEAFACKDIRDTTYTLTKPLAPGQVYVWSVRCWSGKKKSPWAVCSNGNSNLSQEGRRGDAIFCPFKTPGK